MPNDNTFGEKIRYIRDSVRCISIPELAKLTGYSSAYISRLETGAHKNPTLEALEKIAGALGVSVHYLLNPNAITPQEAIPENSMPPETLEWILKRKNLPYITVTMEAERKNIPPDKIVKIIELLESSRNKGENN